MRFSPPSLLNSLVALAVLAVAGGGAYYYETQLHPASCSTPIGYYVGTVDPRFGESQADFEKAITQAAAVWNTAAGKEVLVEDPKGVLPVNLLYDTRQQAAQLGQVITGEQSAYDNQKKQVDALKAQYDAAKTAYQAHQAAFEAENQQYTSQVAYWNARGGAPPSEYQQLNAARAKLATDQQALNAEADTLNTIANSINTAITQLNALAKQTNQKVNTYNAEAGSDFEQGEYIRDASGTRINVYEFTSQQELTRTLAHELGHSLGMEHVTDPSSIMYPYNKGSSSVPSVEDLAELTRVCNLQ